MEDRIFAEINRARADPQSYIATVKNMLKSFEGSSYKTESGEKIKLMEGKAAWSDCVIALERQKSKRLVEFSEGIARACKVIGQKHLAGERGIDHGSILKDFCQVNSQAVFFVQQYEVKISAGEIVAFMVVSQNDQNRNKRVAIFHPNYSGFGCAVCMSGNTIVVPLCFVDKVLGQSVGPGPSSHQSRGGSSEQSTANRGLEVFQQMNKLRKDAKPTVQSLKKQIASFGSDGKQLTKGSTIIKFKEGKSAYQDAIDQLSSLYSIPLLRWSDGLAIACEQHCRDLMSDRKSDFNTVAAKYAQTQGNVYKFVLTGNRTPKQLIESMVIGDGDKKRTMRKKLISPVVKGAGAAFFEHATEGSFAVICIVDQCKDRTEEVKNYKEKQSQIREDMEEEQQMAPQRSAPSTATSGFGGSSTVFGSSGPGSLQDFVNSHLGDRKIHKRCSKISYVTANGQKFKQIYTVVEYQSGEVQQFVEDIAI